jgi:hypothetical protein
MAVLKDPPDLIDVFVCDCGHDTDWSASLEDCFERGTEHECAGHASTCALQNRFMDIKE